MKKIVIFIVMLLLLPIIVFAGSRGDDVTKTEVITCEYNVKPKYSNENMYFKIKSTLLKGTDDKYYIENYSYNDGKYQKIGSFANIYTYDIKTNNVVNDSYPLYVNLTAKSFSDYYKKLNNCPYLLLDISESTSVNIKFTDSKALNSQQYYTVTEADKVKVNDDSPKPTTSKITKECPYNISSSNISGIDKINVNFYMKDNKKKYMSLTVVDNGTDYTGETEVDEKTGGNLVLSRRSGTDYYFYVAEVDVGKIFKNVNGTTFECLSNDEIGVVVDSFAEQRFRITTNMDEIKNAQKDGYASTLGDGNISYDYKEVELEPLQPSLLDCNSLLGNTTCVSGEVCSPAFFLQTAFNVMKYAAIIILIVMSSIDFFGAVGSSDDGALKKAMNKCVIRLILCVVIFFVPTILEYIFTWMKVYSPSTCGIR